MLPAFEYTVCKVLTATLLLLLAAQEAGLPPGWELKPRAEKMAEEVGRLRPLLERLQPAAWVSAGAPEAYEKQWRDCLDGIAHVQNAATRLAARPDSLTTAIETLVRMEAVLEHAGSLTQAVRRYQNPAMAEVLESEIQAAGASREWLRQHARDLSAQREKELEVLEQEAQRCRAQVSRPGPRRP